jgi:hypothetical protein
MPTLVTLGASRDELRDFSRGGSGNNDELDRQINRTIRNLILIAPWRLLASRIRMKTMNNCLPLPREFDKIIQVNIDKRKASVFDAHYEFLDAGPLDISSCDCSVSNDLVEFPGMFPTFYDLPARDTDRPRNWKLMAFSTDDGDTGKTLSIRGLTTYLNEIMTGATPGETVEINRWRAGREGRLETLSTYKQSVNTFVDITAVKKPVTRGYITLFGVDQASATPNEMWFLGKYHPDETHPAYKRYKVQGHDFANGECVVALVQIAYMAAKHEDDILLVQNMDAIGAMMKAINFFDAEDPLTGAQFQGQALTLLSSQLKREQPIERIINVQHDNFACGSFDYVQ